VTTIETVIFGMMLFLDAICFGDGIFIMACAARAGLDKLQRAPSDEPKPSNHSYPNRCKVNGVHDPILPLGNHVSAAVVIYLKIEKLVGHASFPYSNLAGKLLCVITEPKQLSASPLDRLERPVGICLDPNGGLV
jgi:hypothetical protein